MGQRKDNVEIRSINYFGTSCVYPDFLFNGLAVWAISVAARIIVELGVATVRTDADIGTKPSGLAVKDRL